MSKIGIIGAMELEVETLISLMDVKEIKEKAGMKFHAGFLNGAEVVIVRCGVGKVNASACAQILSDLFDVTHLINTGIAGSLNASLDIGDILVSKVAIHHDVDVTIFGYKPGEVPSLGVAEIPADEKMIQIALDTCKEVNKDINAIAGRVVSGDQFIASSEVKDRLINTFKGDCAEMEGASIAQVAYLNNIPFVIIRAISDKADDSAVMDYPSFEKQAAHHCAALVAEMVKNL